MSGSANPSSSKVWTRRQWSRAGKESQPEINANERLLPKRHEILAFLFKNSYDFSSLFLASGHLKLQDWPCSAIATKSTACWTLFNQHVLEIKNGLAWKILFWRGSCHHAMPDETNPVICVKPKPPRNVREQTETRGSSNWYNYQAIRGNLPRGDKNW